MRSITMVIKEYIKNKASFIFIGFFILLFIVEIIVNVNNCYLGFELSRLQGYYKLIFEVFLILLLNINKTKLLVFFLILFFLGQILSTDFISQISIENITTGNIYYFNRYIYIFVFSGALSIGLIQLKTRDKIIRIFKNVMLINSLLIIVGFIFNLKLFKSFPGSSRFGFDGMFVKDGDAAYLYIILIAYLYSLHIKRKDNKTLLQLLGAILISFFLGKKVILLFCTFLVLHFLYHKKLKKYIIPAFVFILSFGFLFYKKTLSFFPFLESFYLKNGLVTTVFSTRDLALKETFNFVYSKWGVQNYLFGSIEYIKERVELEFFDLLFFFGILGTLCYCFMFYVSFFKNNNKLYNQLIFIILLTSFFSGALLISVPSILVLYVLLVNKEKAEFNYKLL